MHLFRFGSCDDILGTPCAVTRSYLKVYCSAQRNKVSSRHTLFASRLRSVFIDREHVLVKVKNLYHLVFGEVSFPKSEEFDEFRYKFLIALLLSGALLTALFVVNIPTPPARR